MLLCLKQLVQIRIQLTIRKENAKADFYLLKDKSEEIENKLGELEWEENPGKISSFIALYRNDTDLTNETDWPNQHEWLKSKLELFDKVFRPRIKALDPADRELPEDEDDA